MPKSIDLALGDQPLEMQSTDYGYRVRLCDRTIGYIQIFPFSHGRVTWFWTMCGPSLPPAWTPARGTAATLMDAKNALSAKLQQWQDWRQI